MHRTITLIRSGLLAASLLIPSLALAVASSQNAAFACNPGRPSIAGHWFDGWQRSPGAIVGGVYAQIENVDVDVQSGAVGTTAWVMVSDSVSKYAQIGWIEHSGGTRNTFLQVKNGDTDFETRLSDPAQSLGAYPHYTVLFNNTPGKFTFKVNGNPWPSANYTVNAPWVPNNGQIYGEIQNNNSQMPGTTSDAMGIFDAHIYYSGSWTNFNSANGDTDDFARWPYDGPYFGTTLYIWDADC